MFYDRKIQTVAVKKEFFKDEVLLFSKGVMIIITIMLIASPMGVGLSYYITFLLDMAHSHNVLTNIRAEVGMGGIISSMIVVTSCIASYFLWKTSRQQTAAIAFQRDVQMSADVVIALEQKIEKLDQDGQTVFFRVYFVIKNIGNGYARDIKVTASEALLRKKGWKRYSDMSINIFKCGISYLAYGQERSYCLDFEHNIKCYEDDYISDANSPITVTWVDYKGDTQSRDYILNTVYFIDTLTIS